MNGDWTSSCVITPTTYGYDSAFDSSTFSFKYNFRTLVTAVAVNQGFLPISALDEVYTNLGVQCTSLG